MVKGVKEGLEVESEEIYIGSGKSSGDVCDDGRCVCLEETCVTWGERGW